MVGANELRATRRLAMFVLRGLLVLAQLPSTRADPINFALGAQMQCANYASDQCVRINDGSQSTYGQSTGTKADNTATAILNLPSGATVTDLYWKIQLWVMPGTGGGNASLKVQESGGSWSTLATVHLALGQTHAATVVLNPPRSIQRAQIWADAGNHFLFGNVYRCYELEVWGETPKACCFADGSCQMVAEEADCWALGGISWLPENDCDPNPCPPGGACCLANGSCAVVPEWYCLDAGGIDWMEGGACEPENPCPPAGACCAGDGTCVTVPEWYCDAIAGVSWWGDIVCEPNNPCPQPPPGAEGEHFYGFQPFAGWDADPVNTATGNFRHTEVDLSIAGRGLPLEFVRYYNNLDRNVTPLGVGWGHSYYIVLYSTVSEPDADVAVRWADGRFDYWREDGQGGYVPATADLYDQLVHNGDDTWTLTRANLDVYQFDADGRLLSMTDKNGNVVTLLYETPSFPSLVSEVVDPMGRGSLVLSYIEYGGSGRLQSMTDWTGRHVDYTYDAEGHLWKVRDVLQQVQQVEYAYDANGYLATITDQRGVATVNSTFHTDGSGRVVEQIDGNGWRATFQYELRGPNETKITRWAEPGGDPLETYHLYEPVYRTQLGIEDPLGSRLAFAHDLRINRNAIADRNGNVTSFAHDERGNVTSVAAADDQNDPHDGGVTAVEYPEPGDPNDPPCSHVPLSKTDAPGCVTEWQYDENCNVALERRYLDVGQTQYVEKSWTYNDFGQRLTETDERGNTHYWIYDTNGLLTEEIDRAGNHTWYGYDALWRRIWVTDGRASGPEDPAYTTHYVYDNADRLIEIHGPPVPSDPNGIVQTFGYDEIGNRTSVTDGNGNTTAYGYDNNSNLIRVEEPEGRTTWYVYDELGHKVRMYDANNDPNEPGSVYTWYVYDDGGRLTEQHDPAGSVWTYEYDPQGNLTRQEDGAGVWTEHEYDALNRRVLTRTAAGEAHMEYDQLGRLTRQTDATGKETEFQYDCLGRLVCVVDAAGGWTEHTYDAAGNLTQIEDARDEVVSVREYDANNRLIYAEDGNGNFYTYGYDAVGNQTWIIDANGQQTYLTYDAASRLIDIAYPDASWVAYEYDNNGNRVAMHEPEGSSTFVYDDLNRLTSDTDRFGMTAGYSYDPVGNRIGLTYPDTKQVTYSHDAANRLATITDWAARQTTYTYEGGGRLDTVTYPNGVIEDRGYDEAGRLVSRVTTDSRRATLLSYEWVRDAVGNPTFVTEIGTLQPTLEQLVIESEYDADNRLVESSRGTYEYDANGNLISRTVNGVTTTFAYDSEDRLVSQTTGGNAVQHSYDGQSYRITRVEDGVATRYVLDRGRLLSHVLCETDAGGNITAYYIHGPQIVARIGVDGRTEVPQYYHMNDIGSMVALTDSAQQFTDRWAYEPFGLARGREGTTKQPFTYVGGLGVMAEADGLYFMRARFYDPDTGRFLGKDPAGGLRTDPLSLHRYIYVSDRPARLTDPSGRWPEWVAETAAGASEEAALGILQGDKPSDIAAGVAQEVGLDIGLRGLEALAPSVGVPLGTAYTVVAPILTIYEVGVYAAGEIAASSPFPAGSAQARAEELRREHGRLDLRDIFEINMMSQGETCGFVAAMMRHAGVQAPEVRGTAAKRGYWRPTWRELVTDQAQEWRLMYTRTGLNVPYHPDIQVSWRSSLAKTWATASGAGGR